MKIKVFAVCVLFVSVFSFSAAYAANLYSNSYELINLKSAETTKIKDYVYPCQYEWQNPPLCRN